MFFVRFRSSVYWFFYISLHSKIIILRSVGAASSNVENINLMSPWMCCRFLFLMVWRMWSPSGQIRDGGRLNFPSFSLFCTLNYLSAPWFYGVFILVPYLLIILHDPDFCYISFDSFQLDPLIEINYILTFQFGPHSFNFQIDFKSLNIFGIEDLNF